MVQPLLDKAQVGQDSCQLQQQCNGVNWAALGTHAYHPLQTEAVIFQAFALNRHAQKGLIVRPVSIVSFATLHARTSLKRMQADSMSSRRDQ